MEVIVEVPTDPAITGPNSSSPRASADASLLEAIASHEKAIQEETSQPVNPESSTSLALALAAAQFSASSAALESNARSKTTGSLGNAKKMERKAQRAKLKKQLREAFTKEEIQDGEALEDERKARHEKLAAAKKFMMENACTTGDGTPKPLVGTSPKDLGEYGVGVQLYFEFLNDMGWLWLFLFLFTLPMLYYTLGGTVLDDFPETENQNFFYKGMALFTPANLGTCGRGAEDCLSQRQLQLRKVFPGSDQLVSDVTPALGILDFVQMLIALAFIIWFRIYKIPAVVRIQDEANVTASDFAIRVGGLPRKLKKDHEHYEALLRYHFEKVLSNCGQAPAQDPEKPNVAEVALIREYDGCISTFLQQGNLLEEMYEATLGARMAKNSGKEEKQKKLEKKREKLKKKYYKLDDTIREQADLNDQEREVCGAFVMFQTEQMKDLVLSKYKPFTMSWSSRLLQPKSLRFRDRRLHVAETCEPEELYWENMDYSWLLHKCRKFCTLTVSFLIVVFCIFVLTYFRSSGAGVNTSSREFDVWIFEEAGQARSLEPSGRAPCMELCQLDVFFDDRCQDGGSPMSFMRTISDTSVFWNVSQETSLHLLQDSSVSCENGDPLYQSPSCTGNNRAMLAYRFQESKKVKCVRVALKDGEGNGRPKPMRIYGCPSSTIVANSSGFFDANGDDWDRDTYCLRFDDAILEGYESPQPVKLRSDCLFPITYEAAKRARDHGESHENSPRLSCYCVQQANSEPRFRIPGYLDSPEAELCKEWAWHQGTQMGIRAAGVLAVMVINNVLLLIFAYFDSLGRYQTATDLASSQVFNLFFATLVNTAIVYNLIGMNVYTSSSTVLGSIRFGQGPFDDLTPLWFVTIGNMLVITIICQIACSVALPVLWVWTVDPLLRWLFTKDVHSQELLNEYHVFPEWTLSLRVAETLVVVFCVFMYSSAYPGLYLCGVIYNFLAYWADKYTLLRGSRRPPGYTKSAIESAVIMMPFAILLHSGFALWLFGNQELMPSAWGGLKGFVETIVNMALSYSEIMGVVAQGGFDVRGDNYGYYLEARLMDSARTAAEPLLWLIFLQGLYYAWVILHSIFRPCFGNSVADAMDWTLKALKITRDSEAEKTTLAEAKVMDGMGLLSYRMDMNPNYEEATMALNFKPEDMSGENSGRQVYTKQHTGLSFHRLEEQFERNAAEKLHEAENYLASALDRLRMTPRKSKEEKTTKNEQTEDVVTNQDAESSATNEDHGVTGASVVL